MTERLSTLRLAVFGISLAVMIAAVGLFVAFGPSQTTTAHAPSGAIFTTLADGSEVNTNLFDDIMDVYIDGGPGPGAPQTAAGLDDGVYVFQVTDPSGKTLLSTDEAKCRLFAVSGGVITEVIEGFACHHATGVDVDHGATTVQLYPFNLTPNPGGVFKVWVTRFEDFLAGCAALGQPGNSGLFVVDCGPKTGGNAHGFVPAHSKTDNFKVRRGGGNEIDVCFFDDVDGDGHLRGDEWIGMFRTCLPFLEVTWIDMNGVENPRFSNPDYPFGTFAHVENADGTNVIVILGGKGCEVGLVHLGDEDIGSGEGTRVYVNFEKKDKGETQFIFVACDTNNFSP